MKKYLHLFFLAAVTMMLSGCVFEGPEMRSYVITTEPRNWFEGNTSGLRYLYSDQSFPEIDSWMMEQGLVEVSMIVQEGRQVQHKLPYTFTVWVDKGAASYTTTETIRYEVSHGLLTLIIEWGDGNSYPVRDTYSFRVTTVDK